MTWVPRQRLWLYLWSAFIILVLVMVVLTIMRQAQAESAPAATTVVLVSLEETFTDPQLRSCVADSLEVRPTDDVSAEELANLRELYCLKDETITSLDGIEQLSGLVGLSISGAKVDDFSPLAKLPNLSILNAMSWSTFDLDSIRNSSIDTLLVTGEIDDLSPLSDMSSLRSLEIAQPYGSPEVDLETISNLTQLQVLRIHSESVTDLTPIVRLTNLLELDIQNVDADLRPLESLTSLRNLRLENMVDPDLTPLTSLDSLTLLDLTGLKGASVAPLEDCKSLRSLTLMVHSEVTGIDSLSKITWLEIHLWPSEGDLDGS